MGRTQSGAAVSEGCSRRYLTAQNLQEFLVLSVSAQLLVQTASSQGWAHKARSVLSRSPGTEALGAGTKESLSLPCTGILAINPENRSLALSWAECGAVQGRGRPGSAWEGERERAESDWEVPNQWETLQKE